MFDVWLTGGIFVFIYALIIAEKGSRAVVSLLGASALVLAKVLELHEVLTHYIEWNTIILLIGMMLIVHITNQTGVFQWAALHIAKLVKGSPKRLFLSLIWMTAIASALLDNVTTVLLMVPITFSLTTLLKLNPIPFLISQIIASNIGGTATLVGDPPNIMIGSANPHLSFGQFLIHLGPISLIIMLVSSALLLYIYRKELATKPDSVEELMKMEPGDALKDPILLRKSLWVLGLTLLGFLLHSILHIEASTIAMTGAMVLMAIGVPSNKVEKTIGAIEWETLFFFAGLFALVGGLEEVGILSALATQLIVVTGGDFFWLSTLILWVSGIASATIDNIPFVATMIPLLQEAANGLGVAVDSAQMNTLWWSLALGACLGGNGTILGASANLIVVSAANKRGANISYWEFLKVGAPITLVSLVLAHAYVILRYF
ncbi:ArsB/NhaD family transporter [Risungbinella massiliensis]|uniref:SLC13 family permease n=1 Tax=Risungbinella massiliensis TaxID=1329796 RepID=UPI0005CC2B82|nr:ArsB/NhaD family transporter [Risungbinella massiliensis]